MQIVTGNKGEGNVTVRSQGKCLDRRHQEVRAHVPYLVYLSAIIGHTVHHWNIVRRDVDYMSAPLLRVRVVFQQSGWHVTPRIDAHDGRRFLDVALVSAPQVLHRDHVATIRACRGVTIMRALGQHIWRVVIAWCRGGDASSIAQYSQQSADVTRKCVAQALPQEFEEVDIGKVVWTEVCFIQYLCVSAEQVKDVFAVVPDIPLLVSAGAMCRRLAVEGPADDEVPKPVGNQMDIDLWPPPKQTYYPEIVPKVAHERPTEGIFTVVEPKQEFASKSTTDGTD